MHIPQRARLCVATDPPLQLLLRKQPPVRRIFGPLPARTTLCHFTRATGLRVVFVSPEVAPWSKVGGLGDVLQALPQALAARGHQVMTVAPRYAAYKDASPTGVCVPLDLPPALSLPRMPARQRTRLRQPVQQAQQQGAGQLAATAGVEGLENPQEGLPRSAAGSVEGPAAGLQQPSLRDGPAPSSSGPAGQGGAGAGSGVAAAAAADADAVGNAALAGAADEGPAAAAAAGAVQTHAEYHVCRQGGVDRVFVDHPLFLGAGIYGGPGSSGASAARGVYTYTHVSGAAHHHPSIELQYNVLCQAALAAPMLLWDGGSGSGSVPAEPTAALALAEEGQGSQQAAAAGGADPSAGALEASGRAPLVFCANDWPTAMLPLRLHHCIRSLGEGLSAAAGEPAPATPAPQQWPAPGVALGESSAAGEHAAVAADAAAADVERAVRELYRQLGPYLRAATSAYCIHNLAYQGLLPTSALPYLSLPLAAVGELCSGSDWRRELESLEEQRGQWRRRGFYAMPPLSSGSGSGGSSQGGQQQEQQQQQRRWQWKRKLREGAGAGVPEGSPEAQAQQQQLAEEEGLEAAAGAAAAAACPSGQLNLKQGALLASDALVTVSPGYAVEVCQDAGMGCGMGEVIAARGITGIMNGIDTAEWDPATDERLPPAARYNSASVVEGKARAKALLQERLGLRLDPLAPLVGFVGRLTEQKGVDVLLGAAPALLAAPPAPAPTWAPPPARLAPMRSPGGSDSDCDCDCAGEGSAAAVAAGEVAGPAAAAVRRAGPGRSVNAGASVGWADGPGGPGEFAPAASSSGGPSWLEGRGRRRASSRPARPGPQQCCLSPAPGVDSLEGREGAGVTNLAQPASLAVPAGDELGDESSLRCGLCEEEREGRSGAARTRYETAAAEAAEAAPGGSGLQLVVLGTGEPWLEAALGGLQQSFAGQAAGVTEFSEEIAHWIMAAADYVLVPSRFEPCGLVAQCGVRYGAVPIVTAVGGLKDLVTPEIGYTVVPFGFESVASTRRQNVQALIGVVEQAVREYGSEAYRRRQAACMALDVSWDRPAAEWEAFLLRMATQARADSAAEGP